MKKFSDEVIDELFKARSEEFEKRFTEEHESQLKKNGTRKKQKALIEVVKKYSSESDEIMHLFDLFDDAHVMEIDYWIKEYYKLGLYDAYSLQNRVMNLPYDRNTFLNYKHNCLKEYTSIECSKILEKTEEYQKLTKEVEKIKEESPKVRAFFEKEIVEPINAEEQEKIQNVIDLEMEIRNMEEKEIFKLGMKEIFHFVNAPE